MPGPTGPTDTTHPDSEQPRRGRRRRPRRTSPLGIVVGGGVLVLAVATAGSVMLINAWLGDRSERPAAGCGAECAVAHEPAASPQGSPSAKRPPLTEKTATPSLTPSPTATPSTPTAVPTTAPPSQPSSQTPTTAPPPPEPAILRVSFDESRRGGSYELANVGGSDLAGWKLTFQVPDGKVVSVEPGTWDQSGDTTTVTGGPIHAGTTITVRVVTRGHDGSPENCTVNGVPC